MNIISKPAVVLDEQRNFSDVINATFAFVKQEFKPLFKTIALYTFAPLLGLAVAFMFYFKGSFEMILSGELGANNQFNLPWGWYSLLVFFAFATQIVLSGLIYEYMLLYKTQGRGNFSPADVGRKLMKDIWALAGYSLLTFLLIGVAAAIIGVLIGLFSTISGFLVVPLVIILFVGLIFIMIPLSLLFAVKIFEDKNYGTTISRCFKLTKNNWWRTFGLIFVMNMIVSTMGAIFIMPLYVYFFFMAITGVQSGEIEQFNQGLSLFLSIFGVFGSTWLYSTLLLAIGFQYTNLKEEKDNDSILNRIEKISETPADEMV